MTKSKLLLIGGGGHCKAVLDSVLEKSEYMKIGIVDKAVNIGDRILGIEIIGCDNDLPNLYKEGYLDAFITVGSIGTPKVRVKLFKLLEKIGFRIPNIIDKSAIVSDYAKLETGIYIGRNTIINADSYIGKGAIINTGAIIEHDCIVEDFCHIAPGAVLCGGVQVGKGTHIGAKSVIKQQMSIGENTMIGMGSVVVQNINEGTIAYGNPCKEVERR